MAHPNKSLKVAFTDFGATSAAAVELAWRLDIPGDYGLKAGNETLVFALGERPEGLVSFALRERKPSCSTRSKK